MAHGLVSAQSNPKQGWLTWVRPCCHIQALEVPLRHWLCVILLAGQPDLQSQLSVSGCPGGAGLWQHSVKAAAWAPLVASCWRGQPDHQGTWGQCFAQASRCGSFEYLPSCRTVGFSIFPGNLFPVAWDMLQLNRVAEIKGPVSILSLLRASLYPWPEHSCRRQQRRENEGKRWWRLSYSGKESDAGNKRFSCMSCSYLSLSLGLITDPLTLEISCDNTESQNSWG